MAPRSITRTSAMVAAEDLSVLDFLFIAAAVVLFGATVGYASFCERL